MKNKLKLVTHDGSFHADDIFVAATLSLVLEGKGEAFEIIRTRDPEIIKTGDYVFDVGGIYDERANRFDHHQVGGAGRRPDSPTGESGIEYASFGLVWKKFGAELCGSRASADLVDRKLVAPIDAHDNGFDLVKNLYEVSPYFVQHFFYSMRPTWREENVTDDEVFFKCLEIAKVVLNREIIQARDRVLAKEIVISAYKNSPDKRIIVLDKNYTFQFDLNEFPEPLFVITPQRVTNEHWTITAIRDDPKTFKNRKDFPSSWAGLKNEELQKITGVPDAIFCHRGLWLAQAKSKEGAIKLAELALN